MIVMGKHVALSAEQPELLLAMRQDEGKVQITGIFCLQYSVDYRLPAKRLPAAVFSS